MKKFLLSFKYAFEGLIKAIKKERNIKIHLLAVVVVIIMGILYKISNLEWIVCIILFGLVISSELINTAIEQTVNLVTKDINPIAKYAKDVKAVKLVAGVVEDKYYDETGIKALADIPAREVLLGRLLGSMQSPIANFARVIKQIAEKDGEASAEA